MQLRVRGEAKDAEMEQRTERQSRQIITETSKYPCFDMVSPTFQRTHDICNTVELYSIGLKLRTDAAICGESWDCNYMRNSHIDGICQEEDNSFRRRHTRETSSGKWLTEISHQFQDGISRKTMINIYIITVFEDEIWVIYQN